MLILALLDDAGGEDSPSSSLRFWVGGDEESIAVLLFVCAVLIRSKDRMIVFQDFNAAFMRFFGSRAPTKNTETPIKNSKADKCGRTRPRIA